MIKKIIDKFKNIPIGLSGLGLALASIGSLWTIVLKDITPNVNIAYLSSIQYICIFFTIFFILMLSIRNFNHKGTFSREIRHPLYSSFIPTISMSCMLIGGFIANISEIVGLGIVPNAFTVIGAIIWYLSIFFHLIFLSLFVFYIVRHHKIKTDSLFASWFVPPVGIIVGCTVANSFPPEIIPTIMFQIIWFFGFGMYSIMLPIMSFKLIYHRPEDKNTLPSIGIYGAPANLSLAGFVPSFMKKIDGIYMPKSEYLSMEFINIMIIILMFLAVMTTLVIYLILPKIFSINFNPSFASLTFPLAIGARATYSVSQYIRTLSSSSPFMGDIFSVIRIISYIELAISSIVIIYVFSRYMILIFKLFADNKKD